MTGYEKLSVAFDVWHFIQQIHLALVWILSWNSSCEAIDF